MSTCNAGNGTGAGEKAFRAIVAAAERVRRKAEMGGGEALSEQLGKLEREFRAERRRDYFRSPLRAEAAVALKAARRSVREGRHWTTPSVEGSR